MNLIHIQNEFNRKYSILFTENIVGTVYVPTVYVRTGNNNKIKTQEWNDSVMCTQKIKVQLNTDK